VTDEPTIRPAGDADEPAMIALEHASAIHHAGVDPRRWRVPSLEAVAESRRRREERNARTEALLAEVDGRVVGMIELWLQTPEDEGSARLPARRADFGISVSPGWQGRGLGTALLKAAEAWARERGATRMQLHVTAANTGAVRLYERLGYELDSLLMDKWLERPQAGAWSRPTTRDAHVRPGARADEVPPTLSGELVTLRPVQPDDRAALIEVLSEPSVVAVWDTRGPERSADELIEGDEDWMVWAIEVEGGFAGSVQASEEVEDADYRHAGIDIFLSARFQGRGIGTDAIRTVARYLIDVRAHHRLTIDPAADNVRAIRTYEKVGFKPVGVMRQYERGPDGTYHDGLLMDMLAGELR
jgi:aminoglycoside 6'-N-acetyltransferase